MERKDGMMQGRRTAVCMFFKAYGWNFRTCIWSLQFCFAPQELDNMAKEEAIMYNLVGHELADVIVECHGLAGNLQGMRQRKKREDYLHELYNDIVEETAERFKHVGATTDGIKREVESMMLDPMTHWGKSSLPVPAHLWKFPPK